ncbi:MAG: 3-oxoacyl-[acyl-carrier-protein] reductase [Candidatus Melainabacteria bacterium RIFOXYA12_FULL_32_12]|nr:MAG: 3-oxoacyl-[acyl-carrier-protein] reductase [Candidatus Melainabacteria bacterium GWF2_32_7]OGI18042.1 MAG: 3-oxoacyl-[acyl-carrier-protein] reductase [Candidatus Melainabacteria bacterium RIFOXYA2_FULL_32_9]OGI27148.1 MAG: 3-oxoacyl-[acyl-carrier-protein] reductase [Candidatus Melainabacteria bacterium RIFOXYA12_FULL_32_12]
MSDIKKIALVTGASRGIGKVCAVELAKIGYVAIINYYPGCDDDANSVVKEIQELGGEAKAIAADVTDSASVQKMVDEIVSEYGRIDVLVNNAGITRDGLLIRMSDADWLSVINTNLNSIFFVTKPVAKVMMKQRTGRIINMASIVGVNGNPGQVNYAAAKAGAIGMTKTLAKELGSRGITVNAIAPGFIDTPMTQHLDTAKIAERIPLGKLGQPEDIAAVVTFLVTTGTYITGQVIGVDGGLVI